MFELLYLVPALPFVSFFLLAVFGKRFSRPFVSVLGAGAAGLSAVTATVLALQFMASPPAGHVFVQTVRTWMNIAGFSPQLSLYFDPLSVVMVLVVTWVSFLILVYSTWYMGDDEGYSRFFAYMNLFVGFMLILVLAGDLLFLYLGWEGVGLCSYLLIGFWHQEEENARAAVKAFLVTRIGDTAFAVGLFLIYWNSGTLDIQQAMAAASRQWVAGSVPANAAALLLLGGAVGKSAQMPLQTWLPDAMAGPTPVSALIHAATMVTAGVYLIARTHTFFSLAPRVQLLVAVIGTATLLLAGSSALAQRDIKRVLAYSTMSQIGYMFLALGAGAWIAAVFHFMVHAFFKALLFLAAGVVIHALHGEQDMSRMGGLRRDLPLVFWVFLIGCASLSAVPLVTAGFYSKDQILFQVWNSGQGGTVLFLAALAGSVLTSLYSFRMFFRIFYGDRKAVTGMAAGLSVTVPLSVLAVLAIIGGLPELPRFLSWVPSFSHFLAFGLPAFTSLVPPRGTELMLFVLSAVASLGGIYAAWLLFLKRPAREAAVPSAFSRLLFSGWGFDRIYDLALIRPFLSAARLDRNDVLDLLSRAVSWSAVTLHTLLRLMQTGSLRWYAAVMAFGAALCIGMVMLL
jgi:NADH-quinone oxidoreductase subunit L